MLASRKQPEEMRQFYFPLNGDLKIFKAIRKDLAERDKKK